MVRGLAPGGGLGVWAYSSPVWLTSTFLEGPTDPCVERALNNHSLKGEIMEAAWVRGQRWVVFPERACSLILSQSFRSSRVCEVERVALESADRVWVPAAGLWGLRGCLASLGLRVFSRQMEGSGMEGT